MHKPDGIWGTAGMDSLPKSHYGRFVHPGHPPGRAWRFPPFYARFVNKDKFTFLTLVFGLRYISDVPNGRGSVGHKARRLTVGSGRQDRVNY
jgi:hypothetical protein